MTRTKKAIGFSVLALSSSLFALSDTTTKCPPILNDLRSRDIPTRAAARVRIVEDRKDLIRGLVNIVKEADDSDDKRCPGAGLKRTAIEILGEIRATEAVPVLYENLKHEATLFDGGMDDMANPGKRYPCVGSLVKIGSPALARAWYRVEMSDDPLERELCSWIIGQVESSQTARLLIERKLAKADPLKKARLEAARSLLETMP